MSQNPYQPNQSQPPVPYSPGPQPGWQQPQPGWTPAYQPQVIAVQQAPSSGAATASLVLGIIGILFGWCLLAIPCVLAVICGHAGLAQTKNGSRSGRGQAVAGLIMGYLALAPAIILFFMFVVGSIGAAVEPSTTPTP